MFANLETGNSTGYYIHSLICVVLMFGLGHLPAPSPITPTGMHVVGIFIGMIYGWLTVGMTWPSILGITALGFSGRMTVVQAFQSGFGNNTILLIFFMFIITGDRYRPVQEESELLNRFRELSLRGKTSVFMTLDALERLAPNLKENIKKKIRDTLR